MGKTNKDIEYGNVNIPDDAFEEENIKVRISLMLRADILNHFKNRAKKEGVGYQVLIQQALANSMNEKDSTKERLSILESEIERLKEQAG
jgi:predicted DNA binding CopG/RHH family protein